MLEYLIERFNILAILNNYQLTMLSSILNKVGTDLLSMWHEIGEVQFKKDNTYLTYQDIYSDRLLKENLPKVANYPVCSEEGNDVKIYDNCWLIDPINGTGAYVSGIPTWAISVALILNRTPEYGMIYFPAFNTKLDLYSENISLVNKLKYTGENFIAVPSNAHSHYEISYNGKTRSLGSCCSAIYYVATGKADFALLGKPKYWDYGSGIPILRKGGGDIYYLSGDSLDYNQLIEDPANIREPLVASHAIHKEQISKLISYCPPKV